MKRVKITADVRGFGKFEIDGRDISNSVLAAKVEIGPNSGGPTTVVLTLLADVDLDLEAEVSMAPRHSEPEVEPVQLTEAEIQAEIAGDETCR